MSSSGSKEGLFLTTTLTVDLASFGSSLTRLAWLF